MNNLKDVFKNKDLAISTREAIEKYLISGGETELNEADQWILSRWTFIDKKLQQGEFKRGEICNMVQKLFNVSRDTAFRDIVNTEHVMCSSYPHNKKYHIGLSIEQFKGYVKEAAEEKDWKSVASMGKVLAGLYEAYPETLAKTSPRTIIMQVLNQHFTDSTIPVDEAILVIDQALQNTPDE